MTSLKLNKDFPTFMLYVFGFLLLWEWLRPISQLRETDKIGIFLVFLGISLLLSYLKIRLAISIPFKVIFVLYAIHFLYFEGPFFQFNWIPILVADLQDNIGHVLNANWTELSNIFRSLLFFVLLWLMTYLIEYWLISRKQIFIFFFMTLVFITVLDTFTPYEADAAIVRTIVAGFAVMGMLTFYRLLDREFINKKLSSTRKWMIPLTVMIMFSVAVGFAAPKPEPIWPDPVPYIKSYGKDSGGAGTKTIGYGTNDSELGGPFEGDNTVVFRAETDSRHYWKVETKDFYTGKGWIVSNEPDEVEGFIAGDIVPIRSFETDKVQSEEQKSIIQTNIDYSHIIYPLGVKQIKTNKDLNMQLNPITEKINVIDPPDNMAPKRYSITYDSPKYSLKALTEYKEMLPGEQQINGYDFYRYTQLPVSLPPRVTELAMEITRNEDNWYEKAQAIEDYFNKAEFVYDQKNVAVPAAEVDYVDQFLFETKRGYCDNFSSSMAIMLRSIGIPTRWVKGYTEGEYKGPGETYRNSFEITNNNAHSWVEVYFPNVGWVPFEPTQGFVNNVQIDYDLENASDNQAAAPKEEKKPEPKKPQKPEEQTKTSTEKSFSAGSLMDSIKQFFVKNGKLLVFGLITMAVVLVLLYRYRLKWFPHYLVWRFKWKKNDEDFIKAYHALLEQLERYGLKRKQDQTLREYARYVDYFFSSKEMGRLTSRYEQYLYKGMLQEGSWDQSRELWENLIKRTIA